MKTLVLFGLILVSCGVVVNGQNVIVTGPAAKPKPEKTPLAGFTREKFDPVRDPNADLAAAVIAASKEKKRIILDVGGEWCGWCVYMDKFFFLNPALDKIRNENFVWVKVNMSPENENATFLAPFPVPTGYPHLYVLDADGKLLHSQDTSPLEAGKGYDLVKFTKFLNKWRPIKAAAKP